MSEKIRVNGETIEPGKTYTGRHVLELLSVSFNNGIYHAKRDMEHDKLVAYDRGYQAGYNAASTDLKDLRSLLRKILMEEQHE